MTVFTSPKRYLVLLVVLALAIAAMSYDERTHLAAQNQGTKGYPVRATGVTNTSTTINGSGIILDAIHCYNPNAAVAYLQLFNVATGTAITVGTTLPTLSIGIPSTAADPQLQLTGINVWFNLGVKIAVTTTPTGSTAGGAAIDCNFVLR